MALPGGGVMTRSLTLVDELVLTLLNEESGYFRQVPGWNLNCAVVGAALAELSLMSRIDTDLDSLIFLDGTATGDPALDPVLYRIAASPVFRLVRGRRDSVVGARWEGSGCGRHELVEQAAQPFVEHVPGCFLRLVARSGWIERRRSDLKSVSQVEAQAVERLHPGRYRFVVQRSACQSGLHGFEGFQPVSQQGSCGHVPELLGGLLVVNVHRRLEAQHRGVRALQEQLPELFEHRDQAGSLFVSQCHRYALGAEPEPPARH